MYWSKYIKSISEIQTSIVLLECTSIHHSTMYNSPIHFCHLGLCTQSTVVEHSSGDPVCMIIKTAINVDLLNMFQEKRFLKQHISPSCLSSVLKGFETSSSECLSSMQLVRLWTWVRANEDKMSGIAVYHLHKNDMICYDSLWEWE